jgi:multisubunit Na+/H+ antiporter MnhG subunit
MDLSLVGIVNNINKLSNNNENFDGKNLSTVEVILIIISLVIGLVLLIWTIYVLATFKLPKEILILCIVLLFLTGPVIPLVLAYVFRNKQFYIF